MRVRPTAFLAKIDADAWPRAQALTSKPIHSILPFLVLKSTVILDPHTAVLFVTVMSGFFNRSVYGISDANLKIVFVSC